MTIARAWAAHDAETRFAPFTFERRALEPNDVRIDILFCGICHSDVHFARGEWGDPHYPCVPGHEIVGRISAVGEAVTTFNVGDLAGVGCMVDSCGHCDPCGRGLEQYCTGGLTGTYMGVEAQSGLPTYGGYSSYIIVREHFALHIRHDEGSLPAVAPLLCAGITLWSPLRHWGAGQGKKVGIVGIGGLGHMGVKLASALGAHVVAFTTSLGKVEEAKRLGVHEVIISRDHTEMAKHAGSFDLIINTASAAQDLQSQVVLLKLDGTLVLVGAGTEKHTSPDAFAMLVARRSIAGSAIGSIAETQEMLNFCAEHAITADIEMVPVQQVANAYDRIVASDVKYRFVIDMATLADV
jgi:alcohol dehydrogenase (NADP+)